MAFMVFTWFVKTWATRQAPHVEQDMLTLSEYLRTPLVFCGVRGAYSLIFYVVSCVLLFVFFIFSHGVVSLFSIYEFDCPSGIFCPPFMTCTQICNMVKIYSKYWLLILFKWIVQKEKLILKIHIFYIKISIFPQNRKLTWKQGKKMTTRKPLAHFLWDMER